MFLHASALPKKKKYIQYTYIEQSAPMNKVFIEGPPRQFDVKLIYLC